MTALALQEVKIEIPDHWSHRTIPAYGEGFELIDSLALLDNETGAFLRLDLKMLPHFHPDYRGAVWRHFPEAVAE